MYVNNMDMAVQCKLLLYPDDSALLIPGRNLRQGTLGRTWVSGPAHKFSVFGPTVMYYI